MKTLFVMAACAATFALGVLYSTETKNFMGEHYVAAVSWVSGEAQKQEENARKFAAEAESRAKHMKSAAVGDR